MTYQWFEVNNSSNSQRCEFPGGRMSYGKYSPNYWEGVLYSGEHHHEVGNESEDEVRKLLEQLADHYRYLPPPTNTKAR